MNSIRHFNIEFKAVAIVLVFAIFATLIPTNVFANVYGEEHAANLPKQSYHTSSEYYATPGDEFATGGIVKNDKSSEYEQLLLEKLGHPATVEDVDPYKRSDVRYQTTDFTNGFTRDYALKNGNYTRLVFGRPVNYKTGEGVWRKINLTLHERDGRFITLDAPYTISFATSSEDGNELIDLDYNGVSLSLSPLNTSDEPSEARYDQVTHTDDELLTENPCENGTVVYDNLFASSNTSPSASLEYTIKPYEIKENIVISEGGFEQYVYSFVLSVNNCNAELKDNCILIYNESGNSVFKLTADYMRDSKDECSDCLSVTLDDTGDGFLVTVIADAEWINEENREFPVRIDPTIVIVYPDEDDAYEAVYIEGNNRGYGLAIGNGVQTYLKFKPDFLTGLPAGVTIGAASLAVNAYIMPAIPFDTFVRAEKINSNWDPDDAYLGNTTPSVPGSYGGLTDSARLQAVGYLPSSISFSLDITSIIQDYVRGNSYGLALTTEAPSGSLPGHYLVPMTAVQITFSDNSGLNSYQSTHSISIDGSGTAYIKDINGDVVFIHPVVSTTGEILPVSIDLVYSTAFKNTETDLYYGNGWRPSVIQTMKAETVTDINNSSYSYYVLTDGTGAKHSYIHSSGHIYKCEEYPIYEYNDLTRIIDYHDGKKACFNASGYLEEFENEYGDSFLISYSGSTPKITGVVDGNGVQISFVYAQSRLNSIKNDDCPDRAVSFFYSGEYLNKISLPTGEHTNISYNSNGALNRFGYRKSSSENNDREYVFLTRSSPNATGVCATTIVTKYVFVESSVYEPCDMALFSLGNPTTCYNAYNFSTSYTEYIYFDRNGRTTSVFDSLGNVSGSEYEGGTVGAMNLLSGQTSAVMTDGNLVEDFTSFSDEWSYFSLFGSGDLVSNTTAGHFVGFKYGDTCFKLSQNIANFPNTEVYASYPVPSADTGKTYTLTAAVDTSELTGSGELVFGIKYTFYGQPNVKMVSSQKAYSNLSSIQYTFEIPSIATEGSVSILIGVKNLSGNLYFDLVSLTEGALARPTNQIPDSSFYNGTTEWTVNGSFSPTVSENDLIRGVVIPGSISSQRSLSRVLPSSVSDGGYLVVSGFGKGKAVSSGKFGIGIHFSSSSSHDEELLFSAATEGWQFVSVIIKIEGFSSDVTISLVNDYNYTDVCFGGLTAEYIDSFGDYSDRSQYVYDSFGRIQFERGFSGAETEYAYENTLPDRISAVYHTDAAGNETSTFYSYSTLVPTQVIRTDESFAPGGNSSLSVDTYDLYAYNAHGKIIESATLSGINCISHKVYDYTSDGRFLHRETDMSGNDITYSYSSATGDLLSVTDGSGGATSFTYDSYGRLIGESEGGSSFGIAYNPYSTGISHNGFSYSFGTNNAGNMTSFAILDANGSSIRTVAGYSYGGTFGQLSEIHYGNGQTKYFGYDSLGRLTYVAFDSNANISNATFVWYYDNNGNVVKSVDRSDSARVNTKQYSYDPTGRLKCVLSSDGNKVFYQYDVGQSGNIETEFFTTALTTREYDSRTESDAASKMSVREGVTGTKTLTFDDIGRITSFAHDNPSSSLNKSYSYVVKEKDTVYNGHTYHLTNETYLVSSETCSLSSVPALTYTYYDNGKIKTISDNGILTNKYEYDALGQLIREDNKKLNNGSGYTIRYTYDNGGNLLAKMIFSYSPNIGTSSLLGTATLLSIPIYGYNATDKDILSTYIGGSYYSYDTVGNPLTYMGKTSYAMTWSRGNKLATVTPNGAAYAQSYLYDADGLRTRKTLVSNDNVSKRINYFWVGDTLKSEWAADGSYEMVFDYDAAGRICGFAYSQNSGAPSYYRYIRNIQGDITHIINSAGAVVAAYTYDTWGSLISIKNGSGVDVTTDTTSIGYINPVRYRGYYYDNETGFYYLKSRYYDPYLGRFINADSQLNIGEGPLGCNLYTYCRNDPVNCVDINGHYAILVIALLLAFTPIGGSAVQIAASVLSYAGMCIMSCFDEDIKTDLKEIEYNPFNSDVSDVLKSRKVSFYKGVPVFRIGEGERSGSFGIILLADGDDENDLRHERGHNWQLMMSGIITYLITVAIPSSCKLDRKYRLYEEPWEALADILGNAKRGQSSDVIARAWWYYGLSYFIFPAFFWWDESY